ncbi:MAG: PilC/PilY family type IV pilus protein [Lysobacteraceae bacterium]
MKFTQKYSVTLVGMAGLVFLAGISSPSTALAELPVAQVPLYISAEQDAPPLNMLVMGRDHKLYYEAYNDASDLNGDGVLDVGYKGHLPLDEGGIDYFGYFDSHRCYSYNVSERKFSPGAAAPSKTCSNAWSGDFLNYLTTSRMDALRKVLYGGHRVVDTATTTTLERAYVPQDAHSWGKEYTSNSVDGYNISDYAPLTAPVAGTRHLFANTTLRNNEAAGPLLRVLNDSRFRIWEWVARENPVAGSNCGSGGSCETSGSQMAHPGHPVSRQAFTQDIEMVYAIPEYKYGNDYTGVTTINCSSNCNYRGNDDNFLTIITGSFTLRDNSNASGNYQFRIKGDDVHDFELRTNSLDGDVLVQIGNYGNNAWSQTATSNAVALQRDTTYWYKFRQEDATGGDGYLLELQKISGNNQFGWTVFDSSSNHKNNFSSNSSSGPVFRFYNLTPSANRSSITDYRVQVDVCVDGALDSNCKRYPSGNYKPTGILHDYGETDQMMFGLLTGTYAKNTQGGVIRKNMSSFSNEINSADGTFTNVVGMVRTIDRFKTIEFNAYEYTCGWIANRPINDGECSMWGNPISEMMWEALRYFSGAASARSEFDIPTNAKDATTLSLPRPDWISPYTSSEEGGSGYLRCATPVLTVISDINPSYDGNVPGSNFASVSAAGDPSPMASLNVSSEVDQIWASEGGGTKQVFIGEAGGVADSNPTVKSVSNFSTVRGLAPEEPSKEGTYYSAGVARFGANNAIGGDKRAMTYAVALASPLPTLTFPVNGKVITVVPFAKSPYGRYGGNVNPGDAFQPTNQIVDFFVETVANTDPGGADADDEVNDGRPYAEFRINYEDVEQGADHDMDAIVRYTFRVTESGELQISLRSEYASGSIVQYIGYIISGTEKDGIYLEVSDCDTNSSYGNTSFCSGGHGGVAYSLNTPPGRDPGYCAIASNLSSDRCFSLPYETSRTFVPGTSSGAELLKDPLWYAAKYGRSAEFDWDEDGDGTPDNYFLVTNAGTLKEQLDKAFAQIIADTRSSGGTAASGSRHNEGFLAYVPEYDTRDWTGDIKAYRVNRRTGALVQPALWSVANKLQGATERDIYFVKKSSSTDTGSLVDFTASNLGSDADQQAAVLGFSSAAESGDIDEVVDFLRGDQSLEVAADGSGRFRARGSVLGDILGSQPTILSTGSYGYSLLPLDEGGGFNADGTLADDGYVKFVEWKKDRTPVAFVGANDGMLHAIDASDGASGGEELFAIIPNSVLINLNLLTDPNYAANHRYFVDGSPEQGDAYLDSKWRTVVLAPMGAGGRSILAIDATDPATDGVELMWEFEHPDLGLTIGRPRIARWNGEWVAIFGNGYNAVGSDDTSRHQASLFIVDLATGVLKQRIQLGNQGTEAVPNGLATTFPVDLDRDADVDLVYAGDYYGNLWRISLKAYGGGDALEAVRLYQGELSEAGLPEHPITGGVNATYHPARGQMVLFGTGKYFLDGDNAAASDSDPENSFFGIWDDPLAASGTYPLDKADLQEQSFVSEDGARVVSGEPVNWNGAGGQPKQFGWYINLPDPGERFVGIPEVSLGRVIFTSFIAEGDECAPGGYNWLNVLSTTSGMGVIGAGHGGGGEGVGSIMLPTDGGGGPAPTPPTVTVPPEGACDPATDPDCETPEPPEECDPSDEDCVPDCDPDTGECGTIDFSARGCETRVGVLTHLGIIDFDSFSCGRQSWKQFE